MAAKVNPIPEGYHTVTPYLVVNGASRALDFYKDAFGASELMRMDSPDGKVMHAEFRIGDSILMIADAFPDLGFVSPEGLTGTPVGMMIYVDDVDTVAAAALAAGATEIRAIENQFYGDRSVTYKDPFGHLWTISTHIEDVSPEEMDRRMAEHAK